MVLSVVLESWCSNKTQRNISVRVKAVSDHWSFYGQNNTFFLAQKGSVISLAYEGAHRAVFQGGTECLSSLIEN